MPDLYSSATYMHRCLFAWVVRLIVPIQVPISVCQEAKETKAFKVCSGLHSPSVPCDGVLSVQAVFTPFGTVESLRFRSIAFSKEEEEGKKLPRKASFVKDKFDDRRKVTPTLQTTS